MEIQKNDCVLLAKGSEIRSYNPSKKVYHLKRQQKVKVWFVLKERKEIKDWDVPYCPEQIIWPGTGGYWCRTDSSNIISKIPG